MIGGRERERRGEGREGGRDGGREGGSNPTVTAIVSTYL